MVETLAKLSRSSNTMMPAFTFDYFSMRRRCYYALLLPTTEFRVLLLKRKAASEGELEDFDNPVSMTNDSVLYSS
jgi:hypothetical protein